MARKRKYTKPAMTKHSLSVVLGREGRVMVGNEVHAWLVLVVIANELSKREELSPGELRGMLARISGMCESALGAAGLLEGDREPGTAVEIARFITDAGWWRTREERERAAFEAAIRRLRKGHWFDE